MAYNTVTFHNAASATANGVATTVEDYSILGVQIDGTFVATVTFEGTIDGTNYVAIEAINVATGAKATTATAAGIYRLGVVGLVTVRARMTWTSGTSITVTGHLSAATDPMIQDIALSANSGVDIGDVDVTSLPAGNLGQRAMAASLSVTPASDITDATYIGDIKFGEALAAGEAHIGEIGGKGIPVAFTFTRPANATPYTAKDAVGISLVVSGATNATPIVMTTGTHGLADGDYVTQAAVGGNTNANGNFYVKVTGYSSTTYALYSDTALTTPVAGNSNYTSGGTVALLFRLPNLFRVNGGSGYITKVRVLTDLSTWVDRLVLHFYSAPVPALLDNGVFTLLWTNRVNRLGPAILPAMTTEAAGSTAAAATITPGTGGSNLPLFVNNNDSSRDLWVAIEDLDAGTPASAQNFYIEVALDAN